MQKQFFSVHAARGERFWKPLNGIRKLVVLPMKVEEFARAAG